MNTKELITKGESEKVEFKSTLRWNNKSKKDDKNITHAVLKTIAAFINSKGGTLIIGVEDNGKVSGLKDDAFPNNDKMKLFLTDLVKDKISVEHNQFITMDVNPIDGEEVLRIDCKKGRRPAYLDDEGKVKCLYIRTGSATNRLPADELFDYIKHNFPEYAGHSDKTSICLEQSENHVPAHIRNELKKNYVVPHIKDESLPDKIWNYIEHGKNVFVTGESGVGKSLLMAYCYSNFNNITSSCYHTIELMQGLEISSTAHVLCCFRKKIQGLQSCPRIPPPPGLDSKKQQLWEKEYLGLVLRGFSETQPSQRLFIFLDALDENYSETREDELLTILREFIQDDDLRITWILSSQPSPRTEWIKDVFEEVNINGLEFDSAKELLLKNLPNKFDRYYPDTFNVLMTRARMDSGLYDSEMLVMQGNALSQNLNGITPISEDALKPYIKDLPVKYREKYSWLFECYTEDSKSRNIPSLKDHAEDWNNYDNSVSYASFLSDILTILSLIRKPIPHDVLTRALEFEEENPEQDFWGNEKYKFKGYPKKVIEDKGRGFLRTAIKDLQRILNIVNVQEMKGGNSENDKYSFCKKAIKQSFLEFIKKDHLRKGWTLSAISRLEAFCVNAVTRITENNLKKMPNYIIMEFLYLLSLRLEFLSRSEFETVAENLKKLHLSAFPELLQERALRVRDEATQWTTGVIKDFNLFHKLPDSLKEPIDSVQKAIKNWQYHLDTYQDVIAPFIRNEPRLSEIWSPHSDDNKLLVPLKGYSRKASRHYGKIRSMEVLPDGRLATGSDDETIRVWDLATEKSILLEGHSGSVTDIKALPDGRLVSSSYDKTVRVWDLHAGESKVLFKGGTYRLKVVRDGSLVACDYSDDVYYDQSDDFIRIWDVATEKYEVLDHLECAIELSYLVYSICYEDESFTHLPLAQLPDGRLVCGGERWTENGEKMEYGIVCIVDKNRNESVILDVQHIIKDIEVLPDGRLILCCDDDTILIWDLETKKSTVLEGHLKCIALLPDGRLATGAEYGNMAIWDPRSGKSMMLKKEHPFRCGHKGFAALPDGRLVSNYIDDSIRILDLDTHQVMELKVAEDSRLEQYSHSYFDFKSQSPLVLLPDGRLASGLEDSRIRILDMDTDEAKVLEGHSTSVEMLLAVLPDGRLASGSATTIRIWDINTGEYIELKRETTGSFCCLVSLPDGCLASSRHFAGTIWICDPHTGESIELKGHEGTPKTLVVLSDGRLASLSNGDGTIRIWNPYTGELIMKLEIVDDSRDQPGVISLNRDRITLPLAELSDNHLASADESGNIWNWNLNTGESLMMSEGHSKHVNTLMALRDDRLVSAGMDGTIRIWDIHTGKPSVLKTHSSIVKLIDLPGNRLALITWDNTIQVWDLDSKKRVSIGFLQGKPYELIYIPKRKSIAVGTFVGIDIFDVSFC